MARLCIGIGVGPWGRTVGAEEGERISTRDVFTTKPRCHPVVQLGDATHEDSNEWRRLLVSVGGSTAGDESMPTAHERHTPTMCSPLTPPDPRTGRWNELGRCDETGSSAVPHRGNGVMRAQQPCKHAVAARGASAACRRPVEAGSDPARGSGRPGSVAKSTGPHAERGSWQRASMDQRDPRAGGRCALSDASKRRAASGERRAARNVVSMARVRATPGTARSGSHGGTSSARPSGDCARDAIHARGSPERSPIGGGLELARSRSRVS
jgi:hypothetical protein